MGFLSLQEFGNLIGQEDVASVTDEPGAFEAAEQGAAETIAAITGAVIPADPAEAPSWSKQPSAWLTFYGLLNRLKHVPAETYLMWEKKAAAARELLALQATRLTGTDGTGSSSASTGKIEGLPEW